MNNWKNILLTLIFGFYVFTAWAEHPSSPRPYSEPNKHGYGVKDDSRPWYDGKDYFFYQDMFDGKGIKPQGQGTYQQFPKDSIPVRFQLGKIKKVYDPFIPVTTGEREIKPLNPTTEEEFPASIDRGRDLYGIYCVVCHGKDGNAGTPITLKGMPAPPITPFLQVFSPSHFYNKIRYGGAFNLGSTFQPMPGTMPPYGAQTSSQDRWDIVNYLKSSQFGKEKSQ